MKWTMSSSTIPEVFMPYTVASINMFTIFLKTIQPQSYFPLGDFDISADGASISLDTELDLCVW